MGNCDKTNRAGRDTAAARHAGTPQYLRYSPAFPLPGEWVEIRLIAAVLEHPAALARFNERHLLPSDCRSEFASSLISALLDGGDVPEIIKQKFNEFSPNGALPWRACVETSHRIGDECGTASEAGAFAAVDTFAAQVKSALLVDSLRWAIERVAADEYAPKDRKELNRLFADAGIGGETAA